MKTVLTSFPITLLDRTYICDLVLSLYLPSRRPCILLFENPLNAPDENLAQHSDIVAHATTSAPAEFFTGMSPYAFAAKTWTENESLWEQLFELRSANGFPLFEPTGKAFTLGFCRAPVFLLAAHPAHLYNELIAELDKGIELNKQAGLWRVK